MNRDRDGVPFEDDFTENRGPSAEEEEDTAEDLVLDPDVDSQDDDHAMHGLATDDVVF
jgi:hypothetical protein